MLYVFFFITSCTNYENFDFGPVIFHYSYGLIVWMVKSVDTDQLASDEAR